MGIIFRNDDISPNTNLEHVKDINRLIKKMPDTRVILGVSFFAKTNDDQTVYPEAPFKDMELSKFYNVDKYIQSLHRIRSHFIDCDIASHGLLHVDHSSIDYDAQEMSILTSCNILETRYFIPPFNKTNEDTIRICENNEIELLHDEHWKSLDFNDFDPAHEKWYFHSWKFTDRTFEDKLARGFQQASRKASEILV